MSQHVLPYTLLQDDTECNLCLGERLITAAPPLTLLPHTLNVAVASLYSCSMSPSLAPIEFSEILR